ncbi:MAG: hypothetical protein FWC29_01230 [Methanomassiliicoccaceae archaeon]|nr:hypothetical protein [Methanomassiliicoccaceae archaeon]
MIVTLAVLFAPFAVSASGDNVKVYYQDVQGIQVDFPNGKDIKRGGELIIVTSSDIYDMERSGIMFYECGPDGKPDMTTTVTPDHYSISEGNVVTHVFRNLTTDIEMSFTELKELGTKKPPVIKDEKSAGGSILATVAMLVSAVLAAVMLAFMAMVIRMLEPIPNGPDGI